MTIVKMDELLAKAHAGKYAVGYFECWDQYSLEGAMEAAEKATCLVPQDILALVREACTNAAEQKIDEIASVLAERCANARALVESYLKRIRGGRP